jgi:tetratricopeptide (TPR) repeat protein
MALGDLLLRAGRTGEAAAILRKAGDEYPDAAEVDASLAVVLQERGELPEALQLAEQAHVALPDSTDTTDTLVALLLQLGKPEQALPLIAQQRVQSPLDQRWLAHAATASRLQGSEEYSALYDYERFVGVFDLPAPAAYESREAFNRILAERLRCLHKFTAHPLDQSLRHGTQTVRDLANCDDAVIADFLKLVEAPLQQYREQLRSDEKHPFLRRNRGTHALAGCWSVQLRQGGFHVNHIHPKGWISSVYYVEVPDEVSDASARAGWLKFGEPRRTTPGAEPAWFVKPEVGRLVLFPSYLWHGTIPISGEEPRMTIAFDVVPAADRS